MRRESIGFVLSAASIRFATASLQATAVAFLALTGIRTPLISYMVILMWASIAIGSLAATLAKRAKASSLIGLPLMALGLITLAVNPKLAALSIMVAGFGSGMAGSALAPSLHRLSSRERPMEGLGSYSLGLSVGLITATLVSSLMPPSKLGIVFIAAGAVAVASAVHVLLTPVPSHANIHIRLPGLSDVKKFFTTRRFAKAFYVNFLYSTIFPLVLSYWSLYAIKVLGMSTEQAFGLLTAMFVISAAIRLASIRLRNVRAAEITALAALTISTILLSTNVTMLVTAGIILFGVPHALVYPVSLYESFESSPDSEIKVSYVIALSSGAGEVLAPLVASLMVALGAIEHIYIISVPLAVVTLSLALAL
ncbi:MFS transporter [Acidilobus sp.]|uniref:MFS transporter n=1 Tax=Acidilobus sp. TaxID=1872109 RepID=UPI003D024B17